MVCVAACQSAPSGEPMTAAATIAQPSAPAGTERAIPALAFAQAACGGCHALGRNELSPNPEAPAFAQIANREGLTAETLSSWLRDAHNYPEAMDFDLDDPRVAELTAHILTLRDPDYQPPTY